MANITTFLSQLISSTLSLFKIIILTRPSKRIAKKTNDSCIILANGPSLKGSVSRHKPEFGNYDIFSVNDFPTTDYFTELKPQHYLFVAPEYWLENVLPLYVSMREKVVAALVEKVDWELVVHAPHGFKQNKTAMEQLRTNNHIKIQFFNTTPVEGLQGVSNVFIGMGLGMPRPHNVLIPCLVNAVRLKYENINVFGADHSWLGEISVNDQNEALVNQKHFYDEGKTKSLAMNKLGKKPGKRKLHEMLEKFVLAFKAYHFIEQFANRRSVKIWNLTPNSFIDAFERKKNL